MTELAVPDKPGADLATRPDAPVSGLVAWAQGARQAHQIAQSLARTPFVPASLRDTPRITARMTPEEVAAAEIKAWETTVGNVTAAILTGEEIGLQPMTALRSIDLIQGTPSMRAHAMRALVLSKGHDLRMVESTPERCVYRGRRRVGTDLISGQPWFGEWQESVWTIDRARQLGITGRDQWTKQPQTMLIARATGEICRLIAPDVLHGVQYASEELDAPVASSAPVTAGEMEGRRPVTVADIEAQAGGGTLANQSPKPDTPTSNDVAKLEDGQVNGPQQASGRRAALHAALTPYGLHKPDRRADKLAALTAIVDHPITTSNDLTNDEVRVVLEFLDSLAQGNPDPGERQVAVAEQVTRGREILTAQNPESPDA